MPKVDMLSERKRRQARAKAPKKRGETFHYAGSTKRKDSLKPEEVAKFMRGWKRAPVIGGTE